jgi:hypothetical protein
MPSIRGIEGSILRVEPSIRGGSTIPPRLEASNLFLEPSIPLLDPSISLLDPSIP